jgi:hypothetical protein
MSCPSCSENSSTTYSRCNPPVSTNCVFYQGENLKCSYDESFAICKGQNMSAVQEEIFNRICQLIGDTDVTEVNIPCTLEVAWNDQDKTVLNYFNYLLEVACAQKAAIASIGLDSLTIDSHIIINEPCCDSCETSCTVQLTIPQAFNDIIKCLCNAKANIKKLEGDLYNLSQEVINVKSDYTKFNDFITSQTILNSSNSIRLSEIESKTTCLLTCNP